MAETVSFLLNAAEVTLEVEPDTTLLSVLREHLDLTGAKPGCGEGACGACTVLIDDRPVRSCVTPIAAAAGRRVLTIEGLEQAGELHPLQRAFLDTGAFQCGYCTPGMIMSGVGLLRQHSDPDDTTIIQAMQGNICRCGVYGRILCAIRQAAGELREGGRR